MIVLGVAGPLGSGKSTVLKLLRELGAATLRADDVSRQLLQPGQPLLGQVRSVFGDGFFAANGHLCRDKLADLIFADNQARRQLNEIMHPLMVAELAQKVNQYRQSQQRPPVVAVEAAVLHQMGLDRLTDKVLLVTANQQTRIRRLQQRDEITQREAQQRMQLHDKLGLADVEADYVIATEGDLLDTRQQVKDVWHDLMQTTDR